MRLFSILYLTTGILLVASCRHAPSPVVPRNYSEPATGLGAWDSRRLGAGAGPSADRTQPERLTPPATLAAGTPRSTDRARPPAVVATLSAASFTGLPAELTVDTTRHTVVVHDGVTPGGFALARQFVANVREFGAVGDGIADDTAAIQAALNGGKHVSLPAGTYRITRPLNLSSGQTVEGAGKAATIIKAYGCDGMNVPAGTNYVTIDGLALWSFAPTGVANPKLHAGIVCHGTKPAACSWIVVRSLDLLGWSIGVDWQYTWNSVVSDLDTQTCVTGVRLFGQSVNNAISNSRILAAGGSRSIYLNADGATIGEGLTISNCLLASGEFGIEGNNGFLSLSVVNCVVDLLRDTGIRVVDPRSMMVSNSWISAVHQGIDFPALGSPVTTGATIVGNRIQVSDGAGIPIHVEGNNTGITISGGSLKAVKNSCVYVDGSNVTVTGVYAETSAAAAVYFGVGTGNSAIGLVGNNTVAYHDRASTSNQTVFASGIQFPTTPIPSRDPRTLDAYEVGTWTPRISADGAGTSTFVATASDGQYVKIGRLVTVTCSLAYSSIGAVGTRFAWLDDLPFPVSEAAGEAVAPVFIEQSVPDAKQYYAFAARRTRQVRFRCNNDGGASYHGATTMVGTSFPASGTIRFTMTYLAAQ